MAATATRSSHNSPHTTKMSSPKDKQRSAVIKTDDTAKRDDPPFNPTSDPRPTTPPRITRDGPSEDTVTEAKPTTTTSAANAAPLAPPPRPSQANSDNGDYFSGVHNTFSLEPNPFEQSFSNQSGETPGRSILPPVASITSPSPLPGITPGWNSLRSGPLSPAMLPGPTGGNDYFDSFRGGFPTPNESSLRTGLTPGGTGSMFPAPSPGTAAFFSSQITPGSADFQSAALRAAAQSTQPKFPTTSAPTSQPTEASLHPAIDRNQFDAPPQQRGQQDMFGQTDVTSVANDLLSFASQGGAASRTNGHYNIPNQPAHINTNMAPVSGQMAQETSPIARRATKGSIPSITGSAETGDISAESSPGEQTKANTRSARSRKAANVKSQAAVRRKAEDTPTKGPANKKPKMNAESINSISADEDSDEDMSPKPEMGENSKKMTDEEKRKNFLERNRVAALKCRQRKKQWLANLQAKVELFSTENDALSAQVTQLREEIVNLKTLLIAHKDCPVSQSQGLGGLAMNSFIGDVHQHANPYGMAMQPNGVQGMISMGQGPQHMQRT